MSELMNDGGDCRTASATPGLLKINLFKEIHKRMKKKFKKKNLLIHKIYGVNCLMDKNSSGFLE